MDGNISNPNNLSWSDEHKRLVLFLFVGGINTLFGYGLYSFMLFINLHYALASLLATVGGVFFNFKTTGVIVFKNRDNRLLFRFIAVYSVTYSVNVTCLRLLSSHTSNMYLAGAVTVLPIACLSYLLLRKFVFGGNKREID
ncbi:MAG: GtrA family protein [Syntrophomonadaceae bacterium]